MSTSPYTPEDERESQLLRASVVEAAMTLGPKVTGWMFQNTVIEGDEDEYDHALIPTPELVSSASSEDSHSVVFSSQDGHTNNYNTPATSANVSRSNSSTHPPISFPARLAPLPRTTLENGFYLDSPFVVVDDGNFPRYPESIPSISPSELHPPPTKKPLKGFRFTSRKRAQITPPLPHTISAPRPILPRLDDPVVPASDPVEIGASAPSRSTTPAPPRSSTPSSASPSSTGRSTPAKLRKPREQDWDFKDADRPSFFLEQQQHQRKDTVGAKTGRGFRIGKGKAGTGEEEDAGYFSEGTGKRVKEKRKQRQQEKEKEKDRDKSPLKRSMTSRLLPKWSTSDLREPVPPLPLPPPLPVPIHDKFSSATREDTKDPNPNPELNPGTSSPYLAVEANTGRAEPSPASSASSFTLLPDLNAVKRLGLDPNKGARRGENGVVGADNKAKLAMLAKLITDPAVPASTLAVSSTSVPVVNVRGADDDLTSEPAAAPLSFIVSSPTPSISPEVLRYYQIPPSPLVSPSPSPEPDAVSPQGYVRGRQAPFPTRPILPTPIRSRSAVRFLVPPQRYVDVDVPRSVRSSYSKDIEREEGGDGSQGADRTAEDAYWDVEGRDDDTVSRASFMDGVKSEAARERLVRGVGAENVSTPRVRWV